VFSNKVCIKPTTLGDEIETTILKRADTNNENSSAACLEY
jgi:hypothetical protein